MKERRRRIITGLVFVVISLVVAFPCLGEVIDRVVAIVNKEVITQSELERETRARIGRAQVAPSPEIYREVLQGLVEQKLILGEAVNLEITVSEREVDRAIGTIEKQNNVTTADIRTALEEQGITWEEYRQQVREDIMRNQAITMKVQSQVGVTDKDINAYYEEHTDEFVDPPKVRIEQLLFPIPAGATAEQRNAAAQKAEEVLKRVKAGHDFRTVAIEVGVIQEGDSLDLGYFNKGELLEPLDRAAFAVPIGSVSEIIETPRGYFIIRVLDRQEESSKTIEEAGGDISGEIFREKARKRFEEWMEELYQQAYIEFKL